MTEAFQQLSLRPELVQAVAELGYEEPTPIQSRVIPLMLGGADVIGQAQTGTGKTAAFALPTLQNLQPGQGGVQSLVLAPTRELAMQVASAFTDYGHCLGFQVLAIYGGASYSRQISRLRRGVDVVVGTPGRLLDLIGRGILDLSQTRIVILDEADEMLSMGFIEDIEAILQHTPEQRQTALFSATLPDAIRKLADRYLIDPESVSIPTKQRTVAAIDQRYYLVNQADKLAALTRLFEVEPVSSALIFARTRLGTGELATELSARGYPAEALNGDLSQETREQVLGRFRRNQVKVLVATDVAARGLDIEDISHVFNFDLPEDVELYVHRVGRTGRAGKSGVAISLVTPQEQWRLRRIEGFTRQKIERASLPSAEDIQKQRDEQLESQVKIWLQRGRCRRERQLAEEMVAQGYDPLEIAAVALKLARAGEKQRPIAHIGEVQESSPRKRLYAPRRAKGSRSQKGKNTSHEKGMVRLSLSGGRRNGVRSADVVSAIARHADIPGSTIGKISIFDEYTLVDVPEQFVPQVLAKNGNYRIRKQAVTLELA